MENIAELKYLNALKSDSAFIAEARRLFVILRLPKLPELSNLKGIAEVLPLPEQRLEWLRTLNQYLGTTDYPTGPVVVRHDFDSALNPWSVARIFREKLDERTGKIIARGANTTLYDFKGEELAKFLAAGISRRDTDAVMRYFNAARIIHAFTGLEIKHDARFNSVERLTIHRREGTDWDLKYLEIN